MYTMNEVLSDAANAPARRRNARRPYACHIGTPGVPHTVSTGRPAPGCASFAEPACPVTTPVNHSRFSNRPRARDAVAIEHLAGMLLRQEI